MTSSNNTSSSSNPSTTQQQPYTNTSYSSSTNISASNIYNNTNGNSSIIANTNNSNPSKSKTQEFASTKVIRFKTCLKNTVYDVMRDRQWKETDSETEWDFFWADVHWIHDFYDKTTLLEHQKLNHFRNHYELTRKDLLVKNVRRMMKTIEKQYGREISKQFDFIATTFVLPQDYWLFQEEFKKQTNSIWIMKPAGRAQGKGIYLINKLSQIPTQMKKDHRLSQTPLNTNYREPMQASDQQGNLPEGPELFIAQRYIHNPYLIGGKKFDMRIYVLVTSYTPLTIYIHRNGFCRFSNYQYSTEVKDINNLYIHATNVAIQKTAPAYDGDKGCKWLLNGLKQYMRTQKGETATEKLFKDIEALIVRSLLSVQKIMINDKHCFELYGYDILIDSDLKPWLLEVNASPSVTAETQFDYNLKHAMLNDVFDVFDMEKRYKDQGLRKNVGGFDLIYNDGPVTREKATIYHSLLGTQCKIPPAPRKKTRFRGANSINSQ